MKITVIAVGQRPPEWAARAVKDYLDRLPSDFKVDICEIKTESRSGRTPLPARAMAAEAQRIRAALPPGALVIALDERGEDWATDKFAAALQRWRDAAESIAFVIGGPDGLDPSITTSARVRLRLSSLTLPHALVRVLLAEQIYRAWSILARHPYHRA